MRLGEQTFRIVTGGAHGMADRKLFTDLLPANGTASLTDVTGAWTTIGLWGPKARDILTAITSDDVANEGFPFATCRTIEIGSNASWLRGSRTSASSAGSSTSPSSRADACGTSFGRQAARTS